MLYTLIRTIHVQFMSVSALCVCVCQAVAGRLFGDLLLGGLLFVSGYTHFTHYWIHADFSWKRLATVSDGELLVHLHVHYSMFIYPDHDVHSYRYMYDLPVWGTRLSLARYATKQTVFPYMYIYTCTSYVL